MPYVWRIVMRSFARALVNGAVVGLVAASAAAAQEVDTETSEVADGVYRFRFASHVGVFVVTPDGVIAADPISVEAAGHFADAIAAAAPGAPLRAVVYSHDHADHASGAAVLRERLGPSAPIIAHDNAAPYLAEAGPDLPPATLTFSEELRLHFGGRDVVLYYLGPNHSDNSVVLYVPDVQVAFAVDFVSHDRVGYRDLPGFHFPELMFSLEALLDVPFETIVFGHGPVGDRGSVERQLRYYRELWDGVVTAVELGMSEDQTVATVQLPAYQDWDRYDEWFAMNVRGMYRAVKR
jgi:glyoxylase-like metal-dependent hydrolase (beta-lactamase superfamily II)